MGIVRAVGNHGGVAVRLYTSFGERTRLVNRGRRREEEEEEEEEEQEEEEEEEGGEGAPWTTIARFLRLFPGSAAARIGQVPQ